MSNQYRKRPVVIEAIRYLPPQNCKQVWAFLDWPWPEDHEDDCDEKTECFIPTLEGLMCASPGDWIIRGIQGERYPIKDAIFRETYEAVESDGSEI